MDNSNTVTYSASFDYVGVSKSNSVVVNGLQSGQKIGLVDPNNVTLTSGFADSTGSVTLNSTSLVYPYGLLRIYEFDGLKIQFVSPTREVWGGSTYSYSAPFRSGGLTRTSTGFLQSTSLYVDDAVPPGAIESTDGGDIWKWVPQSQAPVVSGYQSHLSLALPGEHEHQFQGASYPENAFPGLYHVQYVFIPSSTVPSEIMLQFHDTVVVNSGFETGDFTGWSSSGTIIRKDIVHSGSYSAAAPYDSSTSSYPKFTLAQNFPPTTASPITSLQFWYKYGDPRVDVAQVQYVDGTFDNYPICPNSNCGSWTLLNMPVKSVYGHDLAGNIVSIKYPDGAKVTFAVDALNRVTTATTGPSTLASFTYGSNLRLKTITYGNSVQTSYAYDSRSRPNWIKTVLGSTLLLNLTYTYDGTGNVLSIGNTGSTMETYSFDMLNRLATATGAWGTTRYGYDGLGNRAWMSQSVGGTNITYTYLSNTYERLATAGTTSYTYDNNGNRLSQTVASTVTSYVYDFENRLTKVVQGSSTLGAYAYSPGGMRVLSGEAGNTTIYLNSGVDVLFQNSTLAGVSTITDYVHVGEFLVARMSGGNRFYYHQDHLGNTRLVTKDSNGRTDFSSNYQPFGLTSASTGNDPQFKYTGKPWSSPVQLYYYGARWYDQNTGRFLTRDPLGADVSDPQTMNPYAYVSNNPLGYTDPTGLGILIGKLPCWDWFGLVPCSSSQAGIVATATTSLSTTPEGAVVLTGAVGIIFLYSLVTDLFTTSPTRAPPPPTPTPPGTGVIGLIVPTMPIGITSPGGTGSGVVVPVPVSTPAGLGLNQGSGAWVGSTMEWSLGLANGYVRNLRKAIANPIVHTVCWAGAGFAAVALWGYESAESARQNIGETPDPKDIFGGLLLGCYGASALVYSVMGSF